MLVADRPQVLDRARRSRRHAGDVQPEDVALGRRRLSRLLPARSAIACGRAGHAASLPRTEIQPDQDPFGVRQVADDLLDRSGSRRTSVGSARIWSPRPELRILQEIDDLDPVAPLQVLLADLLQVREGADRLRRLSRDVEPQVERSRRPCHWPPARPACRRQDVDARGP